MKSVKVLNLTGEEIRKIKLDKSVFDVPFNASLVHQALVMYRAINDKVLIVLRQDQKLLVEGENLGDKKVLIELGLGVLVLQFGDMAELHLVLNLETIEKK